MPNDCYNSLTLTGPPEELSRLRDRLAATTTDADSAIMSFSAFIPMPADCADDWYHWCMTHWGTKWEPYSARTVANTGTAYIVDFYTAWCPPVLFVSQLASQYPDLKVVLEYKEPGMGFRGETAYRGDELLYEDSSEYFVNSDGETVSDGDSDSDENENLDADGDAAADWADVEENKTMVAVPA